MHLSIIHGLPFVCVTMLLVLPVQGQPQCVMLKPIKEQRPTCCKTVSKLPVEGTVVRCIEQMENSLPDCKLHAYIFITEREENFCVDPSASWLPAALKELEERGIRCKIMRKVNKAM